MVVTRGVGNVVKITQIIWFLLKSLLELNQCDVGVGHTPMRLYGKGNLSIQQLAKVKSIGSTALQNEREVFEEHQNGNHT